MHKKRQSSRFGILGICLSIVILVIFTADASWSEKPAATVRNGIDNDISEVVGHCIRKTTRDGEFFNSLQGGYFIVPDPKLSEHFLTIPIYGVKGKYAFPDIKVFEKELGLFVDYRINNCLKKARNTIKGRDISIQASSRSQVEISKKDFIDVSLSINIAHMASSTSQIKKVTYRVPSLYYKHYNFAESLIEIQKKNPNAIAFSDMVKLAKLHKVTIQYFKSSKDFKKIIYAITDSKDQWQPIGNYTFMFAVEYNW